MPVGRASTSALRGSIAAAAPYLADLRLESRGTSLDPFLRAAVPSLPAPLGVIVTGQVAATGPAPLAPRRSPARPCFSDVSLLFPEYPVKNREPVRLELANGALRLRALRLAGEGTDLEIEGEARVLGPGRARGHGPRHRRPPGPGRAQPSAARLRERAAVRHGERDHGRAPRRRPAHPGRRRAFACGASRTASRTRSGIVRFNESALEIEGLTGTLAGGDGRAPGPGHLRGGQDHVLRSAPGGAGDRAPLSRGHEEPPRRRHPPLRRRRSAVADGLDRREAGHLQPALRRGQRAPGHAHHRPGCAQPRGGPAVRPQDPGAGHACASTTTWPTCRRGPTSPCRVRPPSP